ncbi:restriction endonuclease subunit R [Endozoicomonas montiporae]|uniref:Restriction endonuclease subunit R n=2 Tax=Endozoicomonas montiporae TaxID=1027273 RepID=A0A081N3F9_9GAMM|nr:DUF3427 domain-containing protein [Endozoicomonas montiporae]AMO58289.1 ATP-dependent helicase IRC3 [Endozoicomonas montiporae CL-33]KEQ12982.1 restriction endonuclease subunit R [Endozoicomonas montiporae]
MSVSEELKAEQKAYPENQRVFKVPAGAYTSTLLQHINRQISDRLEYYSQKDQFEGIIQLTQSISSLVEPECEGLSLPLRRVLFSKDNHVHLPLSDDFSLISPSLITNSKTAKTNFFKNLKFELQTADQFNFMVSFIRKSGLQLLLNPLQSFLSRGKKGRILTSVYMNITQPEALRKLLDQSNIETRVYCTQHESFHTKAYLFQREYSRNNSALIGSSNISKSALINGEEWNVKIPRSNTAEIYDQAYTRFEKLWNSENSIPLTESFIDEYEAFYEDNSKKEFTNGKTFDFLKKSHLNSHSISKHTISPNAMQKEALENLVAIRKKGEQRAVAIAATGTGKTYLAAFDAYQFKASRVLFLAHRDELLESAIKTFSEVFQNDQLCGKLTGKTKEFDRPFLFSTIQTLSKDNNLSKFDLEAFDYIVVDEFHHAQASTYLKVINYFSPKFLFGMTATPERMDGRDVLKLCNYNIVCDIRLRDALSMDLLAPFHYFGVADETVDYDEIEQNNGLYVEKKLVEQLNTNERADYIIKQIKKYTFQKEKLCALGFCVNRDHANFMSQSFNDKGITSTVLTGLSSPQERQDQIKHLQDAEHPLEIIFTVDIFNEGIDIPQVNLLLFLRPTESSTIFIQQLGRGLRKVRGKEYVTVLDFIGNHQNSFMVPLALSGETGRRDFDKDYLKRSIRSEFSDLPAGCYVELDEIAKEKIIAKLDSIRLDKVDYLKRLYQQFKQDLGSSPEILDFYTSEYAPNPYFFFSKFGSLYQTKNRCGDLESNPIELVNNIYLQEIAERLESVLPLKWPYEFAIISVILDQKNASISISDVIKKLETLFNINFEPKQHKALIFSAMKELSLGYKRMTWSFGKLESDAFKINTDFIELIKSSDFAKKYIQDRIDYGIKLFRRQYKPDIFLTKGQRFALYQNYTRNDIQFLSEDTAQKGSWREGVKRVGQDYFLFINLNKEEEVDEHLKYKDFFMNPSTFHWQSQNQTSHTSNVGQHYINHKKASYRIHLFVRKAAKQYNITLPFMYLGQADYVSSSGDQPMSVIWKLHNTVPLELYEDLTE